MYDSCMTKLCICHFYYQKGSLKCSFGTWTLLPSNYLILISKGFLKQLTIKTNGKNSRFDRSSVIIKRNVENMNLHRYIK